MKFLGVQSSRKHGESSGCRWRNGLQIWSVAAHILNIQSPKADKWWSPSFGVWARC